jgi:hypothetical protein
MAAGAGAAAAGGDDGLTGGEATTSLVGFINKVAGITPNRNSECHIDPCDGH